MAAYRILLVAFPLAAFCEKVLPPASVLEPLAIGVATGFISDSPDLLTCGMSARSELVYVKEAVDNLRKGIKTFNMTEIEAALQDVQAFMNGAKGAKKTCVVVEADLKTLIGAIKQVPHQPKALFLEIVHNLLQDGNKILAELSASEKAYKTGRDYQTSGQNLGMAFRRMLVGEMNKTQSRPPLPKGAAEQILFGMVTGFISDSPDAMTCGMLIAGEIKDLKIAVEDMKIGITTMNVTEIEAAISQIKIAFDGTQKTKAQCKAVRKDVAGIVQALEKIHGPKDLITHIVHNFFADGKPIFNGLADAYKAYKTGKNFMSAGTSLGKVFRRMLVGEIHDNGTPTALPRSIDLVV